jgi:polysaccharide export outer membrane protein
MATRHLCAALLLVYSSATIAASAQAPTPAAGSQGSSNPAAESAQPVAGVASDYVIGPDDVLGIVFWREPDLSGDVTVRPDGRITLPVIGEMAAAGLQPELLQQQIGKAAEKYITDPNVAVVVRAINSRRVFITGQITVPGPHPLKGPLTVMQVISMAGGLTEFANPKGITILRQSGGTTETFKFNYKDVARGKNTQQNIQLLPGDTIVVP